MQLVIAEKPSVAKSIANVIGAYKREDGYLEGSGYIVSWCVGHLVELAAPQDYDEKYLKWSIEDLPINPAHLDGWQYKVSNGTKAQFQVLKKLMDRKDVSELVNACDAGREGELIFRLVYHQAGCKKPFKRLWISSMEDTSIKQGFEELKDGCQYDALYAAAVARSQADWLVGMNGTRLFTKLYNKKLTVGRVQTPTLNMVVNRQQQINGFQKQKYWNVHLKLNGVELTKEKIFDETEAKTLADHCRNSSAEIITVENTEKTVNPPKLYDLTTLQREANRYYGYTAQQTLDYTQSLYEVKLVTYPRTDSQFLTDDMENTASEMVTLAAEVFAFEHQPYDVSRVLDSKKVSDHHAIIPTKEIQNSDMSRLSKGERDILLLIAMRLLAATGDKHRIEETEIRVACCNEEFIAKGKRVTAMGWKSFEEEFRKKIGSKPSDSEKMLPVMKKGEIYDQPETSLTEHFTSPPKAYSEDTLLSAMETAGNEEFDEETEKKGLGTPATRASMIEKLVSNHYLQRKGKQLIPTDDGIALADVLPEEVKSPKLTADWENALTRIERGDISAEEFLDGITKMVEELVNKYGSEAVNNPFSQTNSKPQKEQIGICPRCGSPVYEGEKNFYCSSKECSFCIWKETKWLSSMRKKVTKKMAVTLLKSGRVHVTGLYSERKGRCFDADLVLDDTGEYVNFKLDFGGKNAPKGTKKG